ncbi:MAG: hypothetical protein M3160_01905 [Candidatus Eremiobacteraeota bacterium]|nr:hypothetical protein [Candidatus Eremiobacteraeota bacterium]
MIPAGPSPQYEARLLDILQSRNWMALREFTRQENQVPDDVYEQGQHFWEVMLHKLICSRIETLGLHEESRKWLEANGYSTDLGAY